MTSVCGNWLFFFGIGSLGKLIPCTTGESKCCACCLLLLKWSTAHLFHTWSGQWGSVGISTSCFSKLQEMWSGRRRQLFWLFRYSLSKYFSSRCHWSTHLHTHQEVSEAALSSHNLVSFYLYLSPFSSRGQCCLNDSGETPTSFVLNSLSII